MIYKKPYIKIYFETERLLIFDLSNIEVAASKARVLKTNVCQYTAGLIHDSTDHGQEGTCKGLSPLNMF